MLVTIDGSETPYEKMSEGKEGQRANSHLFKKKREIWPESKIRIESLSNKTGKKSLVWKGEASESMQIRLDPGRYVYSCSDFKGKGYNNKKFVGQFLVGATMDLWREYADRKPTTVDVTQVTDGVIWVCKYPACNGKNTSQMGALEHEMRTHGSGSPFDGVELPDESEGIVVKKPGVIDTAKTDEDKEAKKEAVMMKKALRIMSKPGRKSESDQAFLATVKEKGLL